MKLRTAGVLDLGRIEEIHRKADTHPQDAPAARLWSLLSSTLSALLPLSQETLIYVAEDGGKVAGFIQASGQPLGFDLHRATALQVLNLLVAEGAVVEDIAGPLVEHLCQQAVQKGVHRLFVRLPQQDALLPTFRLRGFRQYATEVVVYADAPRVLSKAVPLGMRPMRRGDHRRLYQLYRKVTPEGVSQLEAPTYRDWRSLHGEWTGRIIARGSETQELVVDRAELAGWVKLQKSSGTRPGTLNFLCLPESPLPEELADLGVSMLGEVDQPAWSSLRHYDSHMIDALRLRGFGILLTQLLLVKELAIRVPVAEKGLVPSFG